MRNHTGFFYLKKVDFFKFIAGLHCVISASLDGVYLP